MGACCHAKKKTTEAVVELVGVATETVLAATGLPTDAAAVLGEAVTSIAAVASESLADMAMSTASSMVNAAISTTSSMVPMASQTVSPAANVAKAALSGALQAEKPECKIQMLFNWYTTDACFMAESWQIRSAAGMAAFLLHIFAVCLILEFLRKMQREYDRKITNAYREAVGVVCIASRRMPGHGGCCADKEAQGGKKVCECVDAGASDGKCKCQGEGEEKKDCTCQVGSPQASGSGGKGAGSPVTCPVGQSGRRADKWIYTFGPHPTFGQQLLRTTIYCAQFGIAYYIMLLAMYYNGFIFLMLGLGMFTGHFLFGADNITTGSKQETGTSCC